jgi:glyoxylase-like metal-dependent hydrolase (beta-lactamase superfamily II)
MVRKSLKIFGYVVLGLILLAGILIGVYFFKAKKLFYSDARIVRPDSLLTLYMGGGGNSVILNSDSAVLVIDTKMGKQADKLFDLVNNMADGKKIYVVNTHSDNDHTGGNSKYKGSTIITGKVDTDYWISLNGNENMPTVWLADTMDIRLGDETVTLISVGQAHTWCDIVVYFHNRMILVTGDIIFNKINPALQDKKGTNGPKSIEVLKRLNQIADIELVVPGHGATGGRELITQMLAYFEDMSMAAENPEKEKEIINKYKMWASMPGVLSPAITIDHFRKQANNQHGI